MKLEVSSNKSLVLKNVLIETHLNLDFNEIEARAREFERSLKTLNVQTSGPLITKMSSTTFGDDGKLSLDYSLMIQAQDYLQYKHRFMCQESLIVEKCLYLQFSDRPEFINMATAVLDVYMYEQDIIDSGIVYMVMLESSHEHIVVDYFKPVRDYETIS